jgi:hypothetical protein
MLCRVIFSLARTYILAILFFKHGFDRNNLKGACLGGYLSCFLNKNSLGEYVLARYLGIVFAKT